MKKTTTHLLATLLVMCYALQAKAQSTVKMYTSQDDVSMTYLGQTADNGQLWACQNTFTNFSSVKWGIDGLAYNATASQIETNTKYQLYDGSSSTTTTISSDNTHVHFLKSAGVFTYYFFTWDGKTAPGFADEFQLSAGTISAEVTDKWYGDTDTELVNKVHYKISNINANAFDHAELALSYDNGATWQTVNSNLTSDLSTLSEADVPVMVSMSQDSVRYRITCYPKDSYKVVVADQSKWTYETKNYAVNFHIETPTHATKVVMHVASGSGSDLTDYDAMGLLGITPAGYEIWGCRFTERYGTAYWQIDDGDLMSANFPKFFDNTVYRVASGFTKSYDRKVEENSSHFLRLTGSNTAEYFSWAKDKTFRPYNFIIKDGTAQIASSSAFTLNTNDASISHPFSWALKDVYRRIMGKAVVEMTLDGGKSWQTVYENTYSNEASTDDDKTETLATGTATITSEGDTVRYRLTVYPKAEYAVVVNNGYWRAESQAYPITVDGADCTIKTSELTRDTSKKGYTTNVTWSAFSKLSDIYGGANIQYSTDKGNTWTAIASVTTASGTQSVTLPAGYSSYLLRVAAYPTAKLTHLSALHPTAMSDTLTAECKPAVTTLTATPETGDLTYGQFRKVTISYALNEDLQLTCGKAFISYSYDEGKTWQHLNGFTPEATGTQSVLVDATKKQCKFCIKVGAVVDGTNSAVTKETENISFN